MAVKKIYSASLQQDVWMFDINLGGKRIRESGFRTKREAVDAALALKQANREAKRQAITGRLKGEWERRLEERPDRQVQRLISLRSQNMEARASGSEELNTLPLVISLSQAANVSGISTSRLMQEIKAGRLQARKLGSVWRLLRSDVAKLIRELWRREQLPKRQRANKRGRGRPPEWDEEKRASALKLYETSMQLARAWRALIKEPSPYNRFRETLPGMSTAQISELWKMVIDPRYQNRDIAHRHVAQQLAVFDNDYLRKLLTQARKERKVGKNRS